MDRFRGQPPLCPGLNQRRIHRRAQPLVYAGRSPTLIAAEELLNLMLFMPLTAQPRLWLRTTKALMQDPVAQEHLPHFVRTMSIVHSRTLRQVQYSGGSYAARRTYLYMGSGTARPAQADRH